jgi:hypothetical protein
VFLLLQALLEKLNGNTWAQYGEKLLNFYLVVHSMSPKASKFVTANLPGVSKRQIQCFSSKQCGTPMIHLTEKDMRTAVVNYCNLICAQLKNPSACLAWSVGVDATVISRVFQYLAAHNVVIGGAYPNEWLEVGSTDKDDI